MDTLHETKDDGHLRCNKSKRKQPSYSFTSKSLALCMIDTWKECMMKISEEVSMVNRQLAEAKGILSYAPTQP